MLAAATTGAAITAAGYELSDDRPPIDYCAAVKSHQVQLRAVVPPSGTRAQAAERREARLIVANPQCYTLDEVTAARQTLNPAD